MHTEVPRFIINMHSLHNPHLIRSVLPRNLVAPIPISNDRRQTQETMAKKLRRTREQKEADARARKAKKASEAQAEKSQPQKQPTDTSQVGNGIHVYMCRCTLNDSIA